MANVLADDKKQQVLALGRLGWPLRRIEEATGVRRETASKYLKAAGIDVRLPRARELPAKPASGSTTDPEATQAKAASGSTTDPEAAEAKPASGSTTDPGPAAGQTDPACEGSPDATDAAPGLRPPGRAPAASACEPHRETIELALRLGRNGMAIWQDLVTEHGFDHGYASVRRFVAGLRRKAPAEPCGVIQTAPGQEAQVDYGTGPMVRDPHTGKYRRTRLFVMTLGYSRKAVRLLTFRSSSRI
jgi:transposase